MKVTAKSFGDYYLNCSLQGITIHSNDKKNQSVSNRFTQDDWGSIIQMLTTLRLYNENTDMTGEEYFRKRNEIQKEIQAELTGIKEERNGSDRVTKEEGPGNLEEPSEVSNLQQA